MKFKVWSADVLDCPLNTRISIGSTSELKARKAFASMRLRGFACDHCSEDRGEPVRHYDLRLVKK